LGGVLGRGGLGGGVEGRGESLEPRVLHWGKGLEKANRFLHFELATGSLLGNAGGAAALHQPSLHITP